MAMMFVDLAEHPRPQFHRQRMAERFRLLAGTQAVGRFIDLHDGQFFLAPDDLADQVQFADAYLLAGQHARKANGYDGTIDFDDFTHGTTLPYPVPRQTGAP
jgi:hypothetical protein